MSRIFKENGRSSLLSVSFTIILYFTVLVKVTGHPVMINYSTRIDRIVLYRLQTHPEHLILQNIFG